MVRRLIFVAVVASSLNGCSHASPASRVPAVVRADQADPSPLVKIQAFGYRSHVAHADLVEVSSPQIPHGSDFVVRGKFTEAAPQGDIQAAGLQVDGDGRRSVESLSKSPEFELSIPTSELKPGLHDLHVELLLTSGKKRPFEKPIVFEVDSPAVRVPPSVDPVPLAAAVDVCCSLRDPGSAHASDLQLELGDSLLVEGWAYDSTARSTGRALLLVVDGARAFQAEYGISRPDVATFFRNETYRNSGYEAVVPASAFSVGQHTVNLMLLSKDGKHYYALPKPAATFNIR